MNPVKCQQSGSQGFTLVELMIVVAIVGILSMLAYPSYQGFIKGSNRSAAQADLMSLAAAMERHKAASYRYWASHFPPCLPGSAISFARSTLAWFFSNSI